MIFLLAVLFGIVLVIAMGGWAARIMLSLITFIVVLWVGGWMWVTYL